MVTEDTEMSTWEPRPPAAGAVSNRPADFSARSGLSTTRAASSGSLGDVRPACSAVALTELVPEVVRICE